ncbi:TetR/AcrR family transcriptional regulator [Streptomyces sp. NPDC088847]|uniref:TetR/AcrR family transcriptional regulator n=1 Tax=Streptomyces sp. NPDC088847 TaxID=3365909 RepID=UPI00381D7256
MSRWQPDARPRLETAALELFAEQGFAATTVPQIAARAGLTTRTFFRHFADKREVIFAGDEYPEFAARLIAEAPLSLDPMTLVVEGLRSVADTFEERRERIRGLRRIIRSDEGLRERELRKRAALCEAIRDGFIDRGVAPSLAALVAETGVSLLHVSIETWLEEDDGRTLYAVVLDTLGSLRTVLAPTNGGKCDPGSAGG